MRLNGYRDNNNDHENSLKWQGRSWIANMLCILSESVLDSVTCDGGGHTTFASSVATTSTDGHSNISRACSMRNSMNRGTFSLASTCVFLSFSFSVLAASPCCHSNDCPMHTARLNDVMQFSSEFSLIRCSRNMTHVSSRRCADGSCVSNL